MASVVVAFILLVSWLLALLLGARTLLGAPGIATSSNLTARNKKLLGAPGLLLGARTLLGAPGIATSSIHTTRNMKLLGAPGLTTISKDATRSSWHRY